MRKKQWVRLATRLAAAGAFGSVGVILVLLALENRLVYHPTRDSESWIAPPNWRVDDVWLRVPGEIKIHAWWCPIDGWTASQGAMLYCHGNGGNLSHRSEAIRVWQQSVKQSILIFDYPGYGRSEGQPSEAGCYASAEAAYHWLVRDRAIAPEKVLLYGDSLGAAVAVEMATRHAHRALVLSKPFTSIADMARNQLPWLPARWLIRNRFDSLAKIGRCRQPIFMAHGSADTLVPYTQGERLFAAAPQPKQFFGMKGLGHNDPLPPEFHAALLEFLAKKAAITSEN